MEASRAQIREVGIEQGLSNNYVTSIYQDKQGFFWVGTFDGLNRYDGYEFIQYRHDLRDSLSLKNNWISAIGENAFGNLIVGTRTGGSILQHNGKSFLSIYYRAQQEQGSVQLLKSQLIAIEKGTGQHTFLATTENGLLCLDKGNIATQIPIRQGNQLIYNAPIQGLSQDRQHQFWLIVRGMGLGHYDERSGEVSILNDEIHEAKGLLADLNGNIWVGVGNQIRRYVPTEQRFDSTGLDALNKGLREEIVHLDLARNGSLLISTDGDGLTVFNPRTYRIQHIGDGADDARLTSLAVYTAKEDQHNQVWIGTLRGGINIWDRNKPLFEVISKGKKQYQELSGDFILSFCEESPDKLWIGTDGQGLNLWDRRQETFRHFVHEPGNARSLSNNYVVKMTKDQRGRLWIATYGGGINRYDPSSNSFIRYRQDRQGRALPNFVWELYEDRQHRLWAGSCADGGLYCYNQEEDAFALFDASLKNILTLKEDSQGDLWGGNYRQLIRIDRRNLQHEYMDLGYAVRSIVEDGPDFLWIGTEGGGLVRFNKKTHGQEVFSESEGLSNNAVLNILKARDGKLWLSTFKGLSVFDPNKKAFQNFLERDGLPSNQFNYNAAVALVNGTFLLGTIKGFCSFVPEEVVPYLHVPDIKITDISLNNVPINELFPNQGYDRLQQLQKLRVPYDKSVLTISYTAPEFNRPDKIKYSYYMEGWEEGWRDVDQFREASYGKLPPGKYIFHLRASDTNGDWHAREKQILIEVLSPWWATWWAFLAYSLLLAGMITAYFKYKNEQIRIKNHLLLAQDKLTQEQELQERKESFITYITHELRSPLTLIVNPIKEMMASKPSNSTELERLEVVHRNAKRLLRLADQLLLVKGTHKETAPLRIVRTDLGALAQEVYLCFSEQAKMRNITYSLTIEKLFSRGYVDREKIEISLVNLLSNAFKFTPDGGEICVLVKEEGGRAMLEVSDSGCGVEETVRPHLFQEFSPKISGKFHGFGIGLSLVKKYIDLHEGEIRYEDRHPQGAFFSISLPLGKAHLGEQVIQEDVTGRARLFEEIVEEISSDANGKVPAQAPVLPDLSGSKTAVLLVEDNKEMRQYLKKLLEEVYQVYACSNATQAMEVLYNHSIDLVLTDLMMEPVNGWELCRQVKATSRFCKLPVILITAEGTKENELRGIEYGADDFMEKPFDHHLLFARIRNLLENRKKIKEGMLYGITDGSTDQLSAQERDFLHEFEQVVLSQLMDEKLNVQSLAHSFHMSHSALYKKIKNISGKSVNELIRSIRLKRAAEILLTTDFNINEAAIMVGFNDVKYFREHFQKTFGMNPSEYKRKYRSSFKSTTL